MRWFILTSTALLLLVLSPPSPPLVPGSSRAPMSRPRGVGTGVCGSDRLATSTTRSAVSATSCSLSRLARLTSSARCRASRSSRACSSRCCASNWRVVASIMRAWCSSCRPSLCSKASSATPSTPLTDIDPGDGGITIGDGTMFAIPGDARVPTPRGDGDGGTDAIDAVGAGTLPFEMSSSAAATLASCVLASKLPPPPGAFGPTVFAVTVPLAAFSRARRRRTSRIKSSRDDPNATTDSSDALLTPGKSSRSTAASIIVLVAPARVNSRRIAAMILSCSALSACARRNLASNGAARSSGVSSGAWAFASDIRFSLDGSIARAVLACPWRGSRAARPLARTPRMLRAASASADFIASACASRDVTSASSLARALASAASSVFFLSAAVGGRRADAVAFLGNLGTGAFIGIPGMRSGSSNTGRPAMTGAGFGRCFGAISTAS